MGRARWPFIGARLYDVAIRAALRVGLDAVVVVGRGGARGVVGVAPCRRARPVGLERPGKNPGSLI